jgi:hypothetical protein
MKNKFSQFIIGLPPILSLKTFIIFKPVRFLFLSYFFTHLLFSPQNISAQVIDSIYYSWAVYEYETTPEDRKCYIAATPYKSETSYTATRNPYLSITRYEKSRVEEIGVYAGYEYKMNNDVHLLAGGKHKYLFSREDMAWAKNDYDDKDIIFMMLENQYVKVRSDSSTGHFAVDEYEMKGIARAYARMKELCK